LVVDKTGTLTEGKPSVTRIVPAEGYDEATLLRMAGSVERASEHPLALAVVSAAKSRGITLPEATGFDSPTGKGAIGTVEEKHIVLGNARFLAEKGIDASVIEIQANELREEGATAIFVGIDGRLAGVLAIADAIKMTTASAIGRLREEGIRVVMLTGDNRTTAEVVGRRLGIDDVEAEVLPDRKSAVVARLRSEGRIVAMAGDGVNDAPALAAADVGIAMGSGTDVAIESASVTLLKGDLTGIVRARRLSEATMANIRQNLFFAFIYNAAGIPIAAGLSIRCSASSSHRSSPRQRSPVLGQRCGECAPSQSGQTVKIGRLATGSNRDAELHRSSSEAERKGAVLTIAARITPAGS
jgi:Cu+-exporting ATPase